MFLHSGASLHGHEYSNRSQSSSLSSSPPANAAAQRRNPFLRSALAASTSPRNRNRASVGSAVSFAETASVRSPSSPATPAPAPAPATPSTSTKSRARPVSDYIPRVPAGTAAAAAPSPEPVVRFKEPEHECFREPATPSTPSEAMSEDEDSAGDVSDSDATRTVSSASRGPRRRRAPRKSTTFLLAQPAPKLRHKQRLMHIRPKLFLQMQHLSADGRPRPVVDVYPSSAFAKTIVAPLLKRFPLISRIKSELSVQDIMLVRAEDYCGAQGSRSDSEDDDDNDNIKSRDLVAVLSPLRTEDKAEIVLADGTVWVATPRNNGSYDFVSVNARGETITARWVRKQVVASSKSSPTSPASPIPSSLRVFSTTSVDYKYTFSIIDPNCRRHPIMATLTNSSLDILDSYVTVSQSSNRYPPTSEDARTKRTSHPVEEWQQNFISVSAIWVALRHGWAPNCRPTDLISPTVLSSASSKRDSGCGAASHEPVSPKPSISEGRARRQLLSMARPHQEPPAPGVLPRRATSTGAAFMEKRRAITRANSDYTSTSTATSSNGRDSEGACKTGARRAFSGGDWECKWRAQQQRDMGVSLAATVNGRNPADPSASKGSILAPSPIPSSAPPGYYVLPTSPESASLDAKFQSLAAADSIAARGVAVLADPAKAEESAEVEHDDDRSRHHHHHHHKWRHISGWFRKLGPSR
ncbi:hypothetical protein SLS62_004876 [Diatrype stigma]|uniref:Uncharacterized protein n=1 Tax=Diatrype stigma TaxID=117547 RepID=A0AAN9UQ07_9PEZI